MKTMNEIEKNIAKIIFLTIPNLYVSECIKSARTIIESIPIIFLESGDIQVDDLVISKTNTHFSTAFKVSEVCDNGYIKSDAFSSSFSAPSEEFIVVQRNNSPVITVKKESK